MLTARVTESLLASKFICPYADREGYVALNERESRIKIESTLNDLNRTLKQTSRGGAYYAVYKSVSGSNRQQIRRTLQENHELIRPLVGFIALASEAQQSDSVLSSGSIITQARIVTQVSSSQSLESSLDKICRLPKVKPSKKHVDSIQGKVELVFDYLRKHSLIVLTDKGRGEFTVTGKVDFMYELLEFIDSREHIIEKVNEQKNEQQELSL